MHTSTIEQLQSWYLSNCDGDWEHDRGVRISTIDNPGWSVELPLTGAMLTGPAFLPVEIDRSPLDWIRCWVENERFHAAGGPQNLDEMLRIFLDWAKRGT